MNQLIEKAELATLIPHKGKMFLLDRITSWNLSDWTLTAQTDLTDSFMFFDSASGTIPTWASFELIAQSIAALTSIDCKLNGKPLSMGMILSVSSMHFSLPALKSGTTATISVRRESEVDRIFSFSGSLFIDGTEAASGKLTVMEGSPEQIH